jgi:hypothetical protein
MIQRDGNEEHASAFRGHLLGIRDGRRRATARNWAGEWPDYRSTAFFALIVLAAPTGHRWQSRSVVEAARVRGTVMGRDDCQ